MGLKGLECWEGGDGGEGWERWGRAGKGGNWREGREMGWIGGNRWDSAGSGGVFIVFIQDNRTNLVALILVVGLLCIDKVHELLFLLPDDWEVPKVVPAGAAVIIFVVTHVDVHHYDIRATWDVWDTTMVHVGICRVLVVYIYKVSICAAS
jgi:hypothetical protein